MAVQWGLGLPQENALTNFVRAYQVGEENQRRNELLDVQRQEAETQRERQRLSSYTTALDLEAQDMAGVTDQSTLDAAYARARARATQLGLPDPPHPGSYSPELVQNIRMRAMTVRDQIAAQQQGSFTLGEGQRRYDASGREVARGPDPRPRYYSVPAGGLLVPEPSAGGGTVSLPGPEGAPAGAQPPPQVGEVQEGYRYRGGDPGDPNSWEPVGGAASQGQAPFAPASGTGR